MSTILDILDKILINYQLTCYDDEKFKNYLRIDPCGDSRAILDTFSVLQRHCSLVFLKYFLFIFHLSNVLKLKSLLFYTTASLQSPPMYCRIFCTKLGVGNKSIIVKHSSC